jgi:thiamine-phosphate pyrophosphorylase
VREGARRRQQLAMARLYLCLGLRPAEHDLATFLDQVLGAGVDLIQLREKVAGRDELVAGAGLFRDVAAAHGALFIVNDDPQLAAEVNADGVHVGQEDLPPALAREIVGAERLIGRSTHTPEQFDRALHEDTDYVAIGPVHATPTKAGRPGIGLRPIRHAVQAADRPWFVTGGMTPETAPEVLDLGAHGIVVVRAIRDADDPTEATRRLRDVIDRHRG